MHDTAPSARAVGERLLGATADVFADNGVTLSGTSRSEPVADWLDPISVMGFGGDTLRGSVSFEVPWRVLQASHPSNSTTTEDLVDWVGELSNLVLGKLKTKLRSQGVSIQLGLPTTFTTRESQRGGTGVPLLQYRLRAPDGAIIVRFSAEIDEAFAMTAPQQLSMATGIDLF